MYWRSMPYFDPEEVARLRAAAPVAGARGKTNGMATNPMPALNSARHGMDSGCRTWARLLVSDFLGAIRALYVPSRPEAPHCFYCGKPATRRDSDRDLCERHWEFENKGSTDHASAV
jgi:hypothetical protein